MARLRGGRLAHHPAHRAIDRAGLRGRHGLRAASRLWRRRAAPAGRLLCRADSQHAVAGADLHRLFRPLEHGPQALGRDLGGDRPGRQHGRLHHRDHAGRHPVDPAHPARGGRLPGPDSAAGDPACRAAAGDGARLSRAVEPVRAPDAGLFDHLADLGRGADGGRQQRAVRHLPQLRGLHRRGGGLSRSVGALPLRILGDRPRAVRTQATAGDGAMIQLNSNHLLYLVMAAQWTVLLSLIAFAGGALVCLPIALMRVSKVAALRLVASAYIQLIQGTPLLIVLFLSYFGLGIMGYKLAPLVAAGVALTLYAAAFLGEIWRGCIEAVPRTQWEASDCLGLDRFQQYAYVILPQAFRMAIPPTVGFMVQIVKNTSLASVVGFVELARAGQIVNNSTFEPFIIFCIVAAIYFAMCYPLSLASRFLERRANAGRANH